jgi:hypothetical protein
MFTEENGFSREAATAAARNAAKRAIAERGRSNLPDTF